MRRDHGPSASTREGGVGTPLTRETLTVTQNHPYLRAANDSLVGATDSRSALEGREAIGAHGPGILNAVRLAPGGDWSAAGLLRPGERVHSGKGADLA